MEQSQDYTAPPVSSLLEALKKASKDLQAYPFFTTNYDPQATIEALSRLQTEADTILSNDSNLFKLSQLLSTLKTLLHKLKESQGYSLRPLLKRQMIYYKIYQVAFTIEAEVQAYLDKECVQNLVKTLQENDSEEEKMRVLRGIEKRLSQGFNGDFQELLLKAKVFYILESLLCESSCSKKVKELTAQAIVGLVRFNRNVFVGLVLMGSIIQALISMASCCSIQVLCTLIGLIQIPLIDEIELDGEMLRIISLLSSQDLTIQVAALDCVCEMAYFGRKEAVEAMLELGLINKLMALQRSMYEGNLTESQEGEELESEEEKIEENRPFARCVKRFAVRVEVGEGLSATERKELKMEILRRVREASVSEAEKATIVSEVLWGSFSP